MIICSYIIVICLRLLFMYVIPHNNSLHTIYIFNMLLSLYPIISCATSILYFRLFRHKLDKDKPLFFYFISRMNLLNFIIISSLYYLCVLYVHPYVTIPIIIYLLDLKIDKLFDIINCFIDYIKISNRKHYSVNQHILDIYKRVKLSREIESNILDRKMYKYNAYKLNRSPLYALPMHKHKSFSVTDVLDSTSKRLEYMYILSLLEGKPIFALRDGCKTCFIELANKAHFAKLVGKMSLKQRINYRWEFFNSKIAKINSASKDYFIAYNNIGSKNNIHIYALFKEKDKTFNNFLPKLKKESNVIPSIEVSLKMNKEPIYKETSGEVEVKLLIAKLTSQLNNSNEVQSWARINKEPIHKETSGEVEVKLLIADLMSELNNCEEVQSWVRINKVLNYWESEKQNNILQSLTESIIDNRELTVYMFNPHGNRDTSSDNIDTNQASSSNNIPIERLFNYESDNARIARMGAAETECTNRFNDYINSQKILDRNAAINVEVGNYGVFVPAYNLSKDMFDDNASIVTTSTRFGEVVESIPRIGPSYLFDYGSTGFAWRLMYNQLGIDGGPFIPLVEIGYRSEVNYGKFLQRIGHNLEIILTVLKSNPTALSTNITKVVVPDPIRGINNIYPYCYKYNSNINTVKEPSIKEYLLHVYGSLFVTYGELSFINRSLSGHKMLFMTKYPSIKASADNNISYRLHKFKVDFPDKYTNLSDIIERYGDEDLITAFHGETDNIKQNKLSINNFLRSLNNYVMFIETAGIYYSDSLHKLETALIGLGVYNNIHTIQQQLESENCRQHIPRIVISKATYDTNRYSKDF